MERTERHMIGQRRTVLTACLLIAGMAGTALWAETSHAPRSAAAESVAATSTQNSITVSGGADLNVPPDEATVTFGVQVTRETALEAQVAANEVVAAAVRNLRALHIPDRQIQTANISLQPHYDNSNNITGYDASQTLAVVVYGLKGVGPVVDAGVSAHANSNVSITFGLRDENAARIAALKLAVAAARDRASAAATALGRTLGGARVQMTENGQPATQPVTTGQAMRAPGALSPPTQTFGGTLTFHEDVTLTYTF